MNGIEHIKKAFERKDSLKIMTHVVGGYPDVQTCEQLVLLMAEKGVDLVEIQLPFSDPTADGAAIVQANHQALKNGISTHDVLNMTERIRKKITVPLLLMSYINPLLAYGPEKIVQRAIDIGLDGFIVPDLPPEEKDPPLSELCRRAELAFVPLIAPTTPPRRMRLLTADNPSPFVYAVLRLGVTGAKTVLSKATAAYLNTTKRITGKYIAAGFGIAEPSQLQALQGSADCAVIGSALLRIIRSALANKRDVLAAARIFLEHLSG